MIYYSQHYFQGMIKLWKGASSPATSANACIKLLMGAILHNSVRILTI